MKNKKIVIIDYGLGNIYSINQACKYLGYTAIISSNPADIKSADSIILPGVGAFKVAMDHLTDKELVDPILEFVKKGNPLMGVCLGMQVLFDQSEEFGIHKGLGLIKGSIKKFPNEFNGDILKIPNIGWNKIYANELVDWNSSPLKEIRHEDFVYFIHSYYADPNNKENILTYTRYNEFEYCSSVISDNIYGFQFHPEKSGTAGLSIFKNFLLK